LRVSAVSYLNTWPLVWGFLHGPEQGIYDFRFDLPAQCAAALETGAADIGLVPCAELDRIGLDFLPDLGIACEGPVRSILLISKCPFNRIRTLAADSGSRTSVALAQILLAEVYGCQPVLTPRSPVLSDMMTECDAALIIGDPALRIDPEKLPWQTLDLGEEWVTRTGLPMVFAVWAGKKEWLTPQVAASFRSSWQWGADHMDEIVRRAGSERGFPAGVAHRYLTRNIRYELGCKHLEGLDLFREKVRLLDRTAKGNARLIS